MTLWDLSELIGIDATTICEGLKDTDTELSLSRSLNKSFDTNSAYQLEWLDGDYFPHHAVKAIARYYAPMSRKAEAVLTFLECMGV